MTAIQIIGQQTVEILSAQAKENPRLRKNLNFHANNEAACHRLLNALEPGTYVQPHCHLSADKDETLVVVAGRVGVLLFDASGVVQQSLVLAPATEYFGIHIPSGTFHSMVALSSGSVFFEAKAGPYLAIAEQERAAWAPAEGDPAAANYLGKMLSYFVV
ncbi:WbuC family cupin fold metalloprotein [Undibacterium flavidum]|uniref:WbuC family cupin fold metalloprotein n=1 Tax=Undibacterium flavidum TaxID=2762297 RepID=A0ABR6Y7W5_9BURK|nr:WbuC family cupin fold metalloprotein [Undibacterium flavidum]MBC3872710.1 WbuC family cupin fold metalloprotein [Undibacterium flavidum]